MTADSVSALVDERRAVGRLDRLAIGLSGLCVVHCVATVLFTATIASAGAALANPLFHEIGFGIAMLLGAVALGRGYALRGSVRPLAIGATGLALMAAGLFVDHGAAEIGATVIGVGLLAVAHRLNALSAPGRDLAGDGHRA